MDGHSRVLVKLAPHPVDIVMPTPLARTHVYGGGTGVGADAYAPRLPVPMLESGQLSWAQYEAVQLAGARHAQILPGGERRGFFIGDGTGLGKGREIGGIIIDNRNRGVRRALWLSCSRQLYVDAQRDMLDLFAGDVAVYELGGAATRSLNWRRILCPPRSARARRRRALRWRDCRLSCRRRRSSLSRVDNQNEQKLKHTLADERAARY